MPRALLLSGAAIAALLAAAGPAGAERLATTAEGAFEIASTLIEEGALGEAEAILRTLAAADAGAIDTRRIDRLAAKIAWKRGDTAEAIRILRALSAHDPDDLASRFDLAQLLLAQRDDREAKRLLMELRHDDRLPPAMSKRIARDLATIEERRVVRLDFQAAAAPSTNINAATSAETFQLFGVLPARLDDEARAQSGIGANYQLSGQLRPHLPGGTRGHLAATGQALDYGGTSFDQARTGLEAGFRFANPGPGRGLGIVAMTAERRWFAGDPYAQSIGGRVSFGRPLTPRLRLGFEASAENVRYDGRPDRDGPVVRAGGRVTYVVSQQLALAAGLSGGREGAAATSLANNQGTLTLGAYAGLPASLTLGVQPQVTYRRFDGTSAVLGGRREDLTLEVGSRLSTREAVLSGFVPSLSYRYTDNRSTVDLYDYDRHSVDLGVARSF